MKHLFTLLILMASGIVMGQNPGSIAFECPIVGIPVVDSSICVGDDNPEIFRCTEAEGCTETTYCWFRTDNGTTISVGSNQSSYTPTVTDAGSYTYTRCYSCGTASCNMDNLNSCTNEVVLNIIGTPSATLTVKGDNPQCSNAISSTTIELCGSGGTLPYTFTYTLNNGADNTVSSTSPSGCASVNISSATSQEYVLTSVASGGCTSTVTNQSATITVVQEIEIDIPQQVFEICTGNEVSIDATVTGGNSLSYQWQDSADGTNFSDVSTGGEDEDYTTPILNDTMYYRLIVTDDVCGMVISDIVIANVSMTPSVAISYNLATVCRSFSGAIPLTINPSNVMGTVTASPSGLSLDDQSGAVTPSSSMPGTYEVTLTVGASGGCQEYTGITNITILPDPSVAFTNLDTAMCEGDSQVLLGDQPIDSFAIESGGQFVNLVNDMGEWTLSANMDIGNVSPRTVNLKYIGTANNGCSAEIIRTVFIHEIPNARFTNPPDVTDFCVGDNLTLLTNSSDSIRIISGGQFASLSDNVLTGVAAGTVTVRNYARNPDAPDCASTSDRMFTVRALPILTIPSGNSQSMCLNEDKELSVPGSTSITKLSTSGVLTGNVLTADSLMPIVLEYTRTNNFECMTTVMDTVMVDSLPAASILPINPTVCEGLPLTLTVVSQASNFQWTSGETTDSIVAVGNDDFIRGVTVTDGNQCSNVVSTSVNVNPNPRMDLAIIGGLTDDGVLCEGSSMLVEATSSNGAIIDEFLWSADIGTFVLGLPSSTFEIATSNEGGKIITYTLQATDINGCSSLDAGSKRVNLPPIPDFQTNLMAFDNEIANVFNIDASVSTSQEPNTAIVGYNWGFNPGLNDVNANQLITSSDLSMVNQLQAPSDGTYFIDLEVTDSDQCKASTFKQFEFVNTEECRFVPIGQSTINACTLDENTEVVLDWRPSPGNSGTLSSASFTVNGLTIATISQGDIVDGRYTLNIPQLTLSGEYRVSVDILESNTQQTGCDIQNKRVLDIVVRDPIELSPLELEDLVICDTGIFNLTIELERPKTGNFNLKYDIINPNGSLQSFEPSFMDSSFVLEIPNKGGVGDYLLIINKIEYSDNPNGGCNLDMIEDTVRYSIIPCGCSSEVVGNPSEIELDNSNFCDNDIITPNYNDDGESIYFITRSVLSTNDLNEVEGSIFKNLENGSSISIDDVSGTGETFYVYSARVDRGQNCIILSSNKEFTFYDSPDITLSVESDNIEYCQNQIITISATNNIDGVINETVSWPSNFLLRDDGSDEVYFIGNRDIPTIRGTYSHTIEPVSLQCATEFEYTVPYSAKSAPDISIQSDVSIIWWPGEILACTADPEEVCYQWGYFDNGQEIILDGENDQFLYQNGKYEFFNDNDNLNDDRTYFVDLSDINSCEDQECYNRLFFAGEQFIFPRDEDLGDEPTLYYEISPNPATDQLAINVRIGEDYVRSARILNMQGQLMRNVSLVELRSSLSISDLSGGTYIIELTTLSGRRYVDKFIKL